MTSLPNRVVLCNEGCNIISIPANLSQDNLHSLSSSSSSSSCICSRHPYFLNDFIQASTHDKISNWTLYTAGITAPNKVPKSLQPHARPFTTFHQYSASLLCLHIMNGIKWHFYTYISPKHLAGGLSFSCNCHFYTDISPILLVSGIPFSCNCHFYTDVSPQILDGGFSCSCMCHFYSDVSLKLNDGLSFSCNCYFYTDVSPKHLDGEVSSPST